MSILDRIFARKRENATLRPLYDAVVDRAREPHWYIEGGVPDTLDGRFDMLSTILACVLARLEKEPDSGQQQAWLTEVFIDDMDGNLRQMGIGDMSVGKNVGMMMGSLGGKLSALRIAFDDPDADMAESVKRNIFPETAVADAALAHVVNALGRFQEGLRDCSAEALYAGQLPKVL